MTSNARRLIATLLPDPGDAGARREILERMAGRVTQLAPAGSEERAVPEALGNHPAARGDVRAPRYRQLRQGEGQ